ncbi:MAG: hypothetical protein SWK76_05370 [Actinomycetota bacterium]|nr:hypothetical protein [Actinomycetota bacterium]
MDPLDIIHPDYCESVRESLERAQRGVEASMTYEVKIVTASGEKRW